MGLHQNGLGPGPGPRPRTRPKAKARAPELQPKVRPGPKPGNTPDLHDSRHASGIHNVFTLDFPVPGLMSVAYRCLFCLGLVDQTNGKSPSETGQHCSIDEMILLLSRYDH